MHLSNLVAFLSRLDQMFEKTKEAQTASLSELQNELKSLKSLLVSRNASTAAAAAPTGTPRPYSPYSATPNQGSEANKAASSPFNFGDNPKPSIPAWQLAPSDYTASSPPQKATIEDTKTEGYNVDSAAAASIVQ
jgi:peroxin-14